MKKFNLDSSVSDLHNYLAHTGILFANERVASVEKPGAGNMNVVVRIITDQRALILKQSRPYVEKYPQIEAPVERIATEHQFYQTVQGGPLQAYIPKVLAFDAAENVLLLQDLGNCDDMIDIYAKKYISTPHFDKLMAILSLIHKKKVVHDFPKNMKMRQLNHQHIFVLPFTENNGFSLDAVQLGLQNLSLTYKNDAPLKAIVNAIGEIYLSEGDTLLHGDYYPGSWMTETNHLYIIDPEFCFMGFAEFDLGVMAAHLILATGDPSFLGKSVNAYDGKVDHGLTAKVAGIEIMRRLIGLAQLPLDRTIDEKDYLLRTAHQLINS